MSRARPQLLGDDAIDAALRGLPGWRRTGDELQVRYSMPDFAAAVALTVRVAEHAEHVQHHPEWRVAYRTVEFRTTTHDASGLTQLDVDLAGEIAAAARELGGEV